MIVGTDKEHTTVSEVICDTKIESYIDENDELIESYEIEKDIMKLICEKCEQCIDNNKPINPMSYIKKYSSINFRKTDLELMYYNTCNILSNKIVPNIRLDDLKSNERFMEILSRKSADGEERFVINDKYILTVFSGLLPINKADKVYLEIYDVDSYSFISKFVINKGKLILNKYIAYFFFK
jgi:hypothetical protein